MSYALCAAHCWGIGESERVKGFEDIGVEGSVCVVNTFTLW
jgi:hypothetical protein